eukprot:753326-Hanusia_phi.AAC.1
MLLHDVVGPLHSLGDPADNLVAEEGLVVDETEGPGLRIALLHVQVAVVDGSCCDPRRSTCLQPPHLEPHPVKRLCKRCGWLVASTSCWDLLRAHREPLHGSLLRHHQVLDAPAGNLQVLVLLHLRHHRPPVQVPVHLSARPLYCRALGRVEDAELDPSHVRDPPHDPSQRVDLPHQVPLPHPPDGGVARHSPEILKLVRQQQSAHAQPRGSSGSFASGMSSSYDYHVP